MVHATLETRVRAARMLAGVIWLQALVAAAGVVLTFTEGNLSLAVLFAGLAAVAVIAGGLEWRRHVQAEGAAFFAFAYGVLASIVALAFGYWFYVPVLGVVTLILMLALVYRLAVRSESRHRPRPGHV